MRSTGNRASEVSLEPVRTIDVEVGDVENENFEDIEWRKKVKRPRKLLSSETLVRRLLKKWNNTMSRI